MTKYTYLTLAILLTLSICVNVFFLMGKGIHIHNTYHQEQYQYQNQSQSQLLMTYYAKQGFLKWHGKWMYLEGKQDNPKEQKFIEQIENLEPYQSLFLKVIYDYGYKFQDSANKIFVIYPEVIEDLSKYDRNKYKKVQQ